MELIVANILDMVKKFGEENVRSDLSSFSSPQNPEIEYFIKNNAISFATQKMSITYVVFDNHDGSIVGYFTLANKSLEFEKETVSKGVAKRAAKFGTLDEAEGTFTIHSYLLAQFGKNYAVDNGTRIHAEDLMALVNEALKEIQHRIGGGFIYLDVEKKDDYNGEGLKPHEKLINIYKTKGGYVAFKERHSFRDGKDYVMMLKQI